MTYCTFNIVQPVRPSAEFHEKKIFLMRTIIDIKT